MRRIWLTSSHLLFRSSQPYLDADPSLPEDLGTHDAATQERIHDVVEDSKRLDERFRLIWTSSQNLLSLEHRDAGRTAE